MARLEGAYDQINLRLGNLEGEVRALRTEPNSRIDGLGARMDPPEAQPDRLSFILMALFGGVAASIIATIVARVV
jgi:hypothetical protein